VRIVALADLHGSPAADACMRRPRPRGRSHTGPKPRARVPGSWLDTTFRAWLEEQPAQAIVAIAGNHDFVFEQQPQLVPALPWTYLAGLQLRDRRRDVLGLAVDTLVS
jgi:hypothetical protein